MLSLEDLKLNNMKKKGSKTFEFISYYQTAAETNDKLGKTSYEGGNKENSFVPTDEVVMPQKKHKHKKNKTKTSLVNEDSSSSTATSSKMSLHLSHYRKDTPQGSTVKPIIKNTTKDGEGYMDNSGTGGNMEHIRKKRMKSVSFRFDDTEEVTFKKSKSSKYIEKKLEQAFEEYIADGKEKKRMKKLERKFKNHMKDKRKQIQLKGEVAPNINSTECVNESNITDENVIKIKKKKYIKQLTLDSTYTFTGQANEESTEHMEKKKKKRKIRTSEPNLNETTSLEEPQNKSRKKELKPDKIVKTLSNLSIGDNAHTLSNLLDEMTVADNNKEKKNKKKKSDKRTKSLSPSSNEAVDLEKIDEGKEKLKWKKKWNKDKKDINDDAHQNSVIVENLPLEIMAKYKKLLSDHFGKYGIIQKVGIAELHPTDEIKKVFTTTIVFYSEDAALKALEDDNIELEGNRIRVTRPLPMTETTVVVRSYAELTEQAISSVFTTAGRIRNIRHLIKGKKSLSTVFVEFHNPISVEKALKMAEDAKIGGKKIYVSKFEIRKRQRKVENEKYGAIQNSEMV